MMCREMGSNHRRQALQACALPTELPQRKNIKFEVASADRASLRLLSGLMSSMVEPARALLCRFSFLAHRAEFESAASRGTGEHSRPLS